MNITIYSQLLDIRKRPTLYFSRKSLEFVIYYLSGYARRGFEVAWEKLNGCDYSIRYEESFDPSLYQAVPPEPYGHFIMDEFEGFVRSYYNSNRNSLSGPRMIIEYSNSDEEAFDKFFELLDACIEMKKTGTWGAQLYENDIGEDIFKQYTVLQCGSIDEDEIVEILREKFANVPENPKLESIFWFALAELQWSQERLSPKVKEKALALLNKGCDLDRWERDYPDHVAARKRILQDLREKLECS